MASSNGNLNIDQLAPVGNGQLMTPVAAAQLKLILAGAAKAGFTIPVTEGYRTLPTQVTLFTQRYTKVSYATGLWWNGSYWKKNAGADAAAIPGTSKHGLALAADLGGGMTSWTSAAQKWWLAHEDEYGFSSAQGAQDGEPWHKVYVGGGTVAAATSTAHIDEPIIIPREKNMKVIRIKDGGGIRYALVGEFTFQAAQLNDTVQPNKWAQTWGSYEDVDAAGWAEAQNMVNVARAALKSLLSS